MFFESLRPSPPHVSVALREESEGPEGGAGAFQQHPNGGLVGTKWDLIVLLGVLRITSISAYLLLNVNTVLGMWSTMNKCLLNKWKNN